MIANIIAIVLSYLLGSIPTAYIATRIATGKDIRQLGGGNVGGFNVYREVGTIPALTVAIVDIGKGAAAVAIAYWLLDVSQPFVLAAGLAAIIGHMWMVFLKFSGGKGMAAFGGILILIMLLFGYWQELLILLPIFLIPMIITRNISLSSLILLLFLPLVIWLGTKSVELTTWSIVVGVVIGLRYLPTAKEAWARSENKRDFIFAWRLRDKKEKR